MDGTRLTRLTPREGTNRAWFSKDFSYYITSYETVKTPPVYAVYDSRGREQRVLEDNKALLQRVKGFDLPQKEFFTFTTPEGVALNGWLLKPSGFSESATYPLVMTQYSGPASNRCLIAGVWAGNIIWLQRVMWWPVWTVAVPVHGARSF